MILHRKVNRKIYKITIIMNYIMSENSFTM